VTISISTAASIKLKFPEFSSQPDATIEFAIEEAGLMVDNGWDDAEGTLALMYLAAHYLMVTISRAESGTGQVVKSENFGPMSVTYDTANQPTNLDPTDFTTTPYGLRFIQMAEHNFPAVLII
jgi:hypothetical protein